MHPLSRSRRKRINKTWACNAHRIPNGVSPTEPQNKLTRKMYPRSSIIRFRLVSACSRLLNDRETYENVSWVSIGSFVFGWYGPFGSFPLAFPLMLWKILEYYGNGTTRYTKAWTETSLFGYFDTEGSLLKEGFNFDKLFFGFNVSMFRFRYRN